MSVFDYLETGFLNKYEAYMLFCKCEVIPKDKEYRI